MMRSHSCRQRESCEPESFPGARAVDAVDRGGATGRVKVATIFGTEAIPGTSDRTWHGGMLLV